MPQRLTAKERKIDNLSRTAVDRDDDGGILKASHDKKATDDNSRNLPIGLLTSDDLWFMIVSLGLLITNWRFLL